MVIFDVDSTLINEEKAYEHRMRDMAESANKSYEEIYELAINFYKENKKGDLEVTKLLGLPKLRLLFVTGHLRNFLLTRYIVI